MKKFKYLFSFIFAFCVGFLFINYNGGDIATNIQNKNNKEEKYYKDYDGNFWESQRSYEEYRENDYFVAPDRTYWTSEYNYEQSKENNK